MTSWQKRRRRRITISVCSFLALILAILLIFVIFNVTAYTNVNLEDLFKVSYVGFNTKGYAVVEPDSDGMKRFISEAIDQYEKHIFRDRDVSTDDFNMFVDSITATASNTDNLSNGSQINMSYAYDRELAKKLKIEVDSTSSVITVSGLENAKKLSKDDIFKDLQVTFSGISPEITMEIVNNSQDSFIKNISFNTEEYKEFYSVGDVVSIRAYYSEELCLKEHYSVDVSSEECVMDYTVSGTDQYVSSIADLTREIIDEAIAQGKKAFNNANEYGVRIFCEANLVPVYINKMATFEWLSPSILSVYFKSVNEDAAGMDGNHYNDLDVIYSCKITQADGVTCNAEAVVRFSNIIKKADGSYEYDFSNPKMISASYSDSAIKQVVVGKYKDTYTIEKLSL